MDEGTPTELWRLGLRWLENAVGNSTHPLDQNRATNLARGMRMLGERPPYRDVSAEVAVLREGWPDSAAMVRERWRSVYRANTCLGRGTSRFDSPLYVPDLLIERHGLRPVTEERLAGEARLALDEVAAAATIANHGSYRESQQRLRAALASLDHLRFLRGGSKAFDDQGEPVRATRPRWW